MIYEVVVQVCTGTCNEGVFPVSHPLQHKVTFVVLILPVLIGARWNLHVILISISLIAKGVEHFFSFSFFFFYGGVFHDKDSLCNSSGFPVTHSVDQAGLKLTEIYLLLLLECWD